jgi:uncharacterized DUF497 family protein
MVFRWNQWNLEHLAEHAVTPQEAEWVILNAQRPYPWAAGDGRWLVWGQTLAGRFLQVVFLLEANDKVYVIHARDLARDERRRLRRRRQ